MKHENLASNDVLAWKYLLQNLTLENIHNQFELYKNTCIKHPTSFNRIRESIGELFNVEYNGDQFYPHFRHTIESEFGNPNNPIYFFRVRKIKDGIYNETAINKILSNAFKFEEIQTLDDIWERPAEQVESYQRLSKPKNSALYTSLMTSTALLETNVKEKEDLFFLIIYKSKRKLYYNDCCDFVYYNNLSEFDNMRRYILFEFLRNEFTRILPYSYDLNNQYCSAYYISNKFFTSDDVDGIQYPSTRGLGHMNFAFWSKSVRNCLDFIGLRLCTMDKRYGMQSSLKIFADCFWDSKLEKFEWLPTFSEKSKQIYGDIMLNAFMSK